MSHREELNGSENSRAELQVKIKELERQLSKLQLEFSNLANGNNDGVSAKKTDEDVMFILAVTLETL